MGAPLTTSEREERQKAARDDLIRRQRAEGASYADARKRADETAKRCERTDRS